MTSLTDDEGNVWTWQFDSLGRNFEKHDPNAGTWSFEYDDASRQASQTDAFQTTTTSYDAAGRLATKTSPVGTTTITRGEARPGFFNATQTLCRGGPTSSAGSYVRSGARPLARC